MLRFIYVIVMLVFLFSAGAAKAGPLTAEQATRMVRETEQAFADTMARRDFEGFLSFLSDEAVFISTDRTLRGKQQVGEAWKPFFEGADAPFSWQPALVEVLDSGELALSSGPVHGADGLLLGKFNSIWRYEPQSGGWKIIFDKGSDACPDASP
jgi:ketosteroid isomerase-like protein